MLLLPPSLEDWVPPEHPVRFVRDFVDALDLKEIGIDGPTSEEGGPVYAPDMLLKVWLFGYMERIRSTRGLEKACLQVMPFLWLTGNRHPDHNTLWRFFRNHRAALPKLFRKLMKMVVAADLVGFALHAIDGTKVTAASSTDTALHRKGLEEKLKHLDEFIAAYMTEVSSLEEVDKSAGYAMPKAMTDQDARRSKIRELLSRRIEEREDGAAASATPKEAKSAQHDASTTESKSVEASSDKAEPPPSDNQPHDPADLKTGDARQSGAESPPDPFVREAATLKAELESKLQKLADVDVKHLHEAEPDARMMKGRGAHALGYNAQIVVDHDSDLIVACSVEAQQNDLAQLVPMLNNVRATCGDVAEQTVADGGYASGEQLRTAEEIGANVLVALRTEPETKGAYSKAHFRYDESDDVYVCPRGERLHQIGTNKSHASALHPDAIYRCNNATCPVRNECTKEARGRKIRRPYGEDARERQAQKQQDPRLRNLLGLRKEIVEHLFGIIKAVDGFRRFTVRGLDKVRAQWALVCTAVNLRKLSTSATWRGAALARVG